MMRCGTWPHRLANALVCVALVVAGCGDNEAAPTGQGVIPVRVALFPGGSTLPAHAAVTRGMCERNGLQVELTEGTDLPVFMAALTKGQYDIAMSVPTLALVGAEKHLDLRIVAGLQRQSRERPNAVWLTKDPSIETLGQLKGKTIAVPSLTGIITDALVYLLNRDGVDRREVKLLQTPFPTMGDQLQAGHVDAAVATIPFYTAIAARGFLVHDDVIVEAVRDASGGTVDTAITSVWSTTGTLAREHPETIIAWRKCLTEATDFLERDEPEARALMQSWLKIPARVVEGSPLPDWNVEITPEDLAPYVTISKAVGSIGSDPDVNSLVWQGP
jgi:NitT/TauT family transport system substrate-binding protein